MTRRRQRVLRGEPQRAALGEPVAEQVSLRKLDKAFRMGVRIMQVGIQLSATVGCWARGR